MTSGSPLRNRIYQTHVTRQSRHADSRVSSTHIAERDQCAVEEHDHTEHREKGPEGRKADLYRRSSMLRSFKNRIATGRNTNANFCVMVRTISSPYSYRQQTSVLCASVSHMTVPDTRLLSAVPGSDNFGAPSRARFSISPASRLGTEL